MKPYPVEVWIVFAVILASLIAIHWLAYRVQERRWRASRRSRGSYEPIAPR